jgi:O-antigen/teichoic acid export membrane protein
LSIQISLIDKEPAGIIPKLTATMAAFKGSIASPILRASLAKAVAGVSQLALSAVIARSLSLAEAGAAFLVITLVMVCAAISRAGLDQTLLRFASVAHASANRSLMQQVRQFVGVRAAIGLSLGTIIIFIAADALSQLFNSDLVSVGLVNGAASVLGLGIAAISGEYLKAVGRPSTGLIIANAAAPIGATLLIVGGFVEHDIGGVLLAFSIGAAFAGGFGLMITGRSSGLDVPSTKSDTAKIAHVRRGLIAATLATLTLTWATLLLLGIFRPEGEVALFSIGQRVALLISFFLVAGNSVLAPRVASALQSGGGTKVACEVVAQVNRTLFLISLPAVGACVLFPESLLLLFGAEYPAGSTVLRVLALGQAVNAATGSVGLFLILTGHERVYRKSAVLAAIFAVLGTVTAGPVYGAIGVAAATAGAVAFQNIFCLWQCRQLLGLKRFW